MKRFRLFSIFGVLLFSAITIAAGVLYSTRSYLSPEQFGSNQIFDETLTVPGPDAIIGNLFGLAQFGSSGTQVGLAMGTEVCNAGSVDIDWFALPNNDHPVVPQNLYRMSGGATNDDRFEQIGQSGVMHAFSALAANSCGFGCNGVSGSHLGSGCSNSDTASISAGPNLGSRAWINPFSGNFPGSNPNPNDHIGHIHNGVSHRLLVEANDLNTSLNQGATYYAEAQYITPHESSWCQSHAGECNIYNNVSYRRFGIVGTSSFSFSAVGTTVQTQPAIYAWPGATRVQIEPDPGNDGIGVVGYKVTNPSPGVWHYEYAIYNENLDRAIQSFSVPVGANVSLSNIGFHAPPQHPGWSADGTVGNAGYSSIPWSSSQNAGALIWNCETFAQNQNANAVRWGTMYNFRFDADKPPQNVTATVGFFKTGSPIAVSVQGPAAGPTATITGTVTYGNAIPAETRSVSNVLISGSGLPIVSTSTGPSGDYQLTGFGAGAYTVTPSKTGGVNNISSFDAARVAQHVAAIDVLTGNQLIVADTSGNGTISSFDSAQIARYVAAVSGFGATGNWIFGPVNRSYASVTSNISGEDYSALLMGEVSGNWTNTGAKPGGNRQSAVGSGPEKSAAVELPNLTAYAGKEVIVPVSVQGVANKGVISYEFNLRYDPSVIQPLADPVDLKDSVSRGLSVVANPFEPGLLRVVVYGPMPIESDGVLLNLRFTAVGAPGSVSPLTWERIMLNEGDPPTTATNGQVEIDGRLLTALNMKW